MSQNWVEDIEKMQDKFGTLDWVFDNKTDTEKLKNSIKTPKIIIKHQKLK